MNELELGPSRGDFARYIEQLTDSQAAKLTAATLMTETRPATMATSSGSPPGQAVATPATARRNSGTAVAARPAGGRARPADVEPKEWRAPTLFPQPDPAKSAPGNGATGSRGAVTFFAAIVGVAVMIVGSAALGILIVVAGIVLGTLLDKLRNQNTKRRSTVPPTAGHQRSERS
jgi:Flp pilus assembly protein TadB